MSKSHVGIEYKICPITGKKWETNSILFDKRLKDSLEKETITGFGICPEVQEILDGDMIALVEIDEKKSEMKEGKMSPEGAYRTGKIAYIKRKFANSTFTQEIKTPFIYVDAEVMEHFQGVYEKGLKQEEE